MNKAIYTRGYMNGNGINFTIFDIGLSSPLQQHSRVNINGKELIVLSDTVELRDIIDWKKCTHLKNYIHKVRIVALEPTAHLTENDIKNGTKVEYLR